MNQLSHNYLVNSRILKSLNLKKHDDQLIRYVYMRVF